MLEKSQCYVCYILMDGIDFVAELHLSIAAIFLFLLIGAHTCICVSTKAIFKVENVTSPANNYVVTLYGGAFQKVTHIGITPTRACLKTVFFYHDPFQEKDRL